MSIWPRVVSFTIVLLWIHAAPVSTQERAGTGKYDLERSERVRVTPKGGGERTVGRFVRATDDSLVLSITTRVQGSFEPSIRGFAWNEVRDVERSLGREGHLVQGAVLGVAAGLPTVFSDVEFGLFAPLVTGPLETVSRLERSLGSRSYARDGAFYGAILGLGAFYPGVPYNWAGPPLGALLGLGIGALIETERWGPAVVP